MSASRKPSARNPCVRARPIPLEAPAVRIRLPFGKSPNGQETQNASTASACGLFSQSMHARDRRCLDRPRNLVPSRRRPMLHRITTRYRGRLREDAHQPASQAGAGGNHRAPQQTDVPANGLVRPHSGRPGTRRRPCERRRYCAALENLYPGTSRCSDGRVCSATRDRRPESLVVRRFPLDVIDDQHRHGALLRFQLQPELFAQRVKKR